MKLSERFSGFKLLLLHTCGLKKDCQFVTFIIAEHITGLNYGLAIRIDVKWIPQVVFQYPVGIGILEC